MIIFDICFQSNCTITLHSNKQQGKSDTYQGTGNESNNSFYVIILAS